MSLAQAYFDISSQNKSLPAILRGDEVIAHGDLWQIATSFALRMRDLGVSKRSLVVINTHDIVVFLAMLFATSLRGARVVAAGNTLLSTKPLRPTHFFQTSEVAGTHKKFETIDRSWLPTAETQKLTTELAVSGCVDDEWLYVHTTGSTGRPKFISLSERVVLDRSSAVSKDFPFREATLATTFAIMSRPFIARSIAALLNAGAICAGKDIEFWKKSGVNLVCGAPGQLEYLFKDAPAGIRFDRVESSGAHLPEHFIPKLLDHFETAVDVYGATETNKSFETIYRRGDHGRIIKTANPRDSVIEIVSPEGDALGAGKIGSVRVRNSYLANGYLNDPVATAKSFRDGWFYPGDLAAWGEKGELMIVGREDDLINIGGYKMNAGMLDMFFKRIPGIVDAIAFNNPKIDAVNKVLVFAVFEDEHRKNEVIANACELATTQMKFLLVPSSIRSVRSIPRTEVGDPDRQACRKMVAQRAEIEIDDDQR